MSINKIKNYLLNYLQNEDNEGKVICIAGEWGTGKTYFWNNNIKKNLDKDKNIYLSLYGISNLDQIFYSISAKIFNVKDFSSLIGASNIYMKGLSGLVDKGLKKFIKEKLPRKLKEHSFIICFDDFERKSSELQLNDIFGFINRFIEDYPRIKIVIILNDDAFTGLDAEIYQKTKEKSISKYIHFNPSIDMLFSLIYTQHIISDNKKIGKYRKNILDNLKKLRIKNGRTYRKVLDNILEWYIYPKILDRYIINALTLATINFIDYNIVLEYDIIDGGIPDGSGAAIDIDRKFCEYQKFNEFNINVINNVLKENAVACFKTNKIIDLIDIQIENSHFKVNAKKNYKTLESIYIFGFVNRYDEHIKENTLNSIHSFIKNGIIIDS